MAHWTLDSVPYFGLFCSKQPLPLTYFGNLYPRLEREQEYFIGVQQNLEYITSGAKYPSMYIGVYYRMCIISRAHIVPYVIFWRILVAEIERC
jgi:hypothetical protein